MVTIEKQKNNGQHFTVDSMYSTCLWTVQVPVPLHFFEIESLFMHCIYNILQEVIKSIAQRINKVEDKHNFALHMP